MYFSRDEKQLPLNTGSLGVVCSVVIIYHPQGLFSTCSSSSISEMDAGTFAIFEKFCPAANHEMCLQQCIGANIYSQNVNIDMCRMYTWNVAIRIHYTIYEHTEALFEGNILSYLSNRDVRHLFNGYIYLINYRHDYYYIPYVSG